MSNIIEEDDAESRFLKARQQRAQQKSSNRDQQSIAAAQELAEARKELSKLLETTSEAIQQKLASFVVVTATSSPEENDAATAKNNLRKKEIVNEAMTEWRNLQEGVSRIVNHVKLPAHDVQQANTALSRKLQEIENFRSNNNTADTTSSAGTGVAEQNKKQENRARRKFRFRRLQNYDAENEEEEEEKTTSKENVTASSTAASTTSATLTTSSSSSTNNSNNKRENLEPGTYLIVARLACFVRHCHDSKIFFAPVGGSVFLADLKNCTVYLSAVRQLRMKDCHNCDIYVCCGSTPVIEDSTHIRFGGISEKSWKNIFSADASIILEKMMPTALNYDLETTKKRLAESYKAVDDFTWLRSTPSPHWKLIPQSEYALVDDVNLPEEMLTKAASFTNLLSYSEESCTKL